MPEGVRVVSADARDAEAIAGAIAGQDAVVNALGAANLGPSTILKTAMAHIVAGMRNHEVTRIVAIASAGIDREIPPPVGWLAHWFLRNVLADHRGAADLLREGDLAWTVLRPMGLTDGPLTRVVRSTSHGVPRGGREVSRADVAHFLVDALARESSLREAPALAY